MMADMLSDVLSLELRNMQVDDAHNSEFEVADYENNTERLNVNVNMSQEESRSVKPQLPKSAPKKPKSPRKQQKPILTAKNVGACMALDRLPFEVLHQIIDDLPLLTILDLSLKLGRISSERPCRFDQAVLNHLRYQHVFKDLSELQEVRSVWSLYHAIWQSTCLRRPGRERAKRHHHLSELMMFCRTSSISSPLPDGQELWDEIHRRIIEILSSVNVKRKIEALQGYADSTVPDVTYIKLWSAYYETILPHHLHNEPRRARNPAWPSRAVSAQDWESIHESERHLVTLRSKQLLRMADMIEKHPEMLKLASDPSQEPRRNIHHVVMGLRHRAKKALNVRFLSDDAKGSAYLKYEHFGLVPFDKDLEKLIQIIGSQPYLETLEDDPTGTVRVVTVPFFNHRFEIDNDDIECVLDGLSSVYPKPLFRTYQNRIKRVAYTGPFSCGKPVFLCPPVPHDKLFNPDKKSYDSRDTLVLPHDEKEFEWLEAFLKSCDYLKSKGVWGGDTMGS